MATRSLRRTRTPFAAPRLALHLLPALLLMVLFLALTPRQAAAQGSVVCSEPSAVVSGTGVRYSAEPILSRTGARVAFWSTGNLALSNGGNNADGSIEVFLAEYDLTRSDAEPTFTQITDSNGSILGGFNLAPALSADGRYLVFFSDRDLIAGRNSDANFEIFRYDVATGRLLQVTETTGGSNLLPSMSADGRRIAFLSDATHVGLAAAASGNLEVVVASIGSGDSVTYQAITENTPLGTTNDDPQLSGDGRVVVHVVTSQDGNTDLYRTTIATGETQAITSGGKNYQPSLSADGSVVAFVSDQQLESGVSYQPGEQIFVSPHPTDADKSFKLISRNRSGNNGQPAISADGDRVAYHHKPTNDQTADHVYIYDLINDAERQLDQSGNSDAERANPAISGDGTFVLFEENNNLKRVKCPVADLWLVVAPDADSVRAGETIGYEWTVRNDGISLVSRAEVGTTLPQGFTFAAGSEACEGSGRTVSCALEDLLPGGDTRTFTVTAEVDPGAVGAAEMTVVAETDEASDVNPANNRRQVRTTVRSETDLQLSALTASPNTALVGEEITFTVRVHNEGPALARNVLVTDTLPLDPLDPPSLAVAFVRSHAPGGQCAASDGVVSCTFTEIEPKETVRADIVTRITAQDEVEIENRAEVSSPSAIDLDPDNNSARDALRINTQFDLRVDASISPSAPVAGAPVSYTLIAANDGPSVATSVVITNVASSQITLTTDAQGRPVGTCDGASCTFSVVEGNTFGVSLGDMQRDDEVRVTVAGVVDPAFRGTINNTVDVTSLTEASADRNLDNNRAVLESTVEQRSDLAISAFTRAGDLVAGQPVSYTVTGRNNGPSVADDLTLTITLPADVTLNDLSTTLGTCSGSGATISCAVDELAPDGTVEVTVDATVSQGATGTLTALAGIGFGGDDPDPDNNQGSASGEVKTLADLSVDKSVSPTQATAGETRVTYDLVVTNHGPSPAVDVELTDNLDNRLTNVSVSSAPSGVACSVNSSTVTCVLGTVESGGSRTISIQADVRASATGSVNTSASVSSSTEDPNNGNNSDAVTLTIVRSADVGLALSVTTSNFNVGGTVTYEFTVDNQGPSDTSNVQINTTIPDLNDYDDGSGVSVTPSTGSYNSTTGAWTISNLAAGDSASLTAVVTFGTGVSDQTVTTQASIASADGDSSSDDNAVSFSDTADPAADLALDVTSSDDTPNVGDSVTITFAVTNSGPETATGTSVDYTLPSNKLSPSGSGSCSPGNIAASSSASCTVTATVVGSGSIVVSAQADSNEHDHVSGNEDDSVTLTVDAAADLQLSADITGTQQYSVGQTFEWTLTLFNDGPDTARNVVVTSTLPAPLTNADVITSAGNPVVSGGRITWTLASLNPGVDETLIISRLLDSSQDFDINAGVAASEKSNGDDLFDPDPGNNNADVSVTLDPAADLDVDVDLTIVRDYEVGEQFTYRVRITNNGPDQAPNVVLTHSLPSEVLFPSTLVARNPTTLTYSYDGTPTSNGTTVSGFDIDPGKSVAFFFTSESVPLSVAGEDLTYTVTGLTSDRYDYDPSFTDPTETVHITGADLMVTKDVSSKDPNTGDEIVYTIIVTNTSVDAAQGVVLTDSLPSEISLVDYQVSAGAFVTNTGRWEIGDMDPGGSTGVARLLITATVNPDHNGDTITNTVTGLTATSPPDRDTSNNTASVDFTVQHAELSIGNAVLGNATPNENETVTFNILVTNGGPYTASNVVVTNTLAPGLLFIDAVPSNEYTYNPATREGVWTLAAPLPEGETASLLLYAGTQAGTGGKTLTNTVETATAVQEPTPPTPVTATVTVQGADLAIDKVVNTPTPTEGDTITYTVRVTNTGPFTTTNVAVLDQLPNEVAYSSHTASPGTTYTTSTGLWDVGTLADQATAVLTVTAVVTDALDVANLTITNTAVISSSDLPDNNHNNGADEAHVTVTVNNVPHLDLNGNAPGIDYTTTFTETGPAVFVVDTSSLQVTDPDGTLASATITLTNRPNGASETLNVTTTGSITSTYSSGVLTLSGEDSVANYQTVLRSVTYSNTANAPDVQDRIIRFVVDDGTDVSATATTTVTIVPKNDPPALTPVITGTVAYVEQASPVTIDSTFALSDPDDTNMGSATIAIVDGYQSGAETLAFTATGAITGTWYPVTATLSLTGTDTITNYEKVLHSVTFANTSDDPTSITNTRLLSVTVTDGNADGVGAESTTVTRTIEITPTNDKPVITTTVDSETFTEGGTAVTVDDAIEVSDVDDTELSGATVRISGNYQAGFDELSFTDTTTITHNWDDSTGTLTLTGTDTITNYRAALRSITYTNTSEHPTSTGITRTVTFTVTDADSDGAGAATSDAATRTIDIAPVNDAPTADMTAGLSVDEDAPLDLGGHITVTDADAGTGVISVTLEAISGTITVSDSVSSGVTAADIVGNASNRVVISQTLDAITNTLSVTNGVQYQGNLDFYGTDTVTVTVNDRGNTGPTVQSSTITRAITVTPVVDAPRLGGAQTQHVTDEETAQPFTNTFTIENPDDASATMTVTVSLDAATGSVGNLGAFSGSGGTYTGTGTSAALQTDLRGWVFTPTQNLVTPTQTVSTVFTVTASNGISETTDLDTTVEVTSVNDAPQIAGTAGQSMEDDDAPKSVFSSVTITDADAAFQTMAVTVTLDLAAKGTLSGTGFFDAGNGVYTTTGTASSVQTAIQGVAFDPTENRLRPGSSETVTFTVDVSDGISVTTNAGTTVVVTSVNDEPQVTVSGTLTTFESIDLDLGPRILITDVDAFSDPISVTLQVNSGVITVTGGVSVTGNGTDNVVVTDTLNAITTTFATAGNVRYRSELTGTHTLTVTVDDLGNGGATVALSGTVTAPITVTGRPDLQISLSDGETTAAPKDVLVYTIHYTNSGSIEIVANDLVITETVPAATTFISVTGVTSDWKGSDGSACSGGEGTTCYYTRTSSLGIGASGIATFTVKIDANASGQTITNTATIGVRPGKYGPDKNPSDNVAPEDTTTVGVPELNIIKSYSGPTSVQPGDRITYTITYSNSGSARATGIVITETVPANSVFSDDTIATWSNCNDGTQAGTVCTHTPGGSGNLSNDGSNVDVDFIVTVTDTVPAGIDTVTNTVRIGSDQGVTDLYTLPVSIDAAPVLTITKSVTPTSVLEGEPVTYTLRVTNTGNQVAADLVITDALPTNASFVTATNGGQLIGGSVVSWTHASLGVNVPLSVTFTVTATQTITNSDYRVSASDGVSAAGAVSVTTTIRGPKLQIRKTADSDTAIAGQTNDVTYSVVVSNTGDLDASSVTISDTLPTAIDAGSVVSSTSTPDLTCSGAPTIICSMDTLTATTAVTLTITGTVTSGTAHAVSITNTAGVTSTEIGTPVTSSVPVTVNRSVALTLTKSAVASVQAGAEITYTIVVTNQGPSDASSVTVSDTLDAQIDAGSVVSDIVGSAGTCSLAGQLLTCPLGDLQRDASATVLVTGTVTADTSNGYVIRNTAGVTSTEQATPASNEVQTTVTRDVSLTVTKSGTPGPVTAGNTITYSVVLTNGGQNSATDVVLTDTLPISVSIDSYTDDGFATCGDDGNTIITCTLNSLAPNTPVTLTITGTVKADTLPGTLVNRAVAASDEDTAPEDTESTNVETEAALAIAKSQQPGGAVRVGDVITYTLTITNSGPSHARDVRITDTLPVSLTFGGVSNNPAHFTETVSSGRVITWAVASLPVGAPIDTIVYTATVTGMGTLTNSVVITTTTTDPAGDNSASTSLTAEAPTFAISKVQNPENNPITPDDRIVYTVTVTNTGSVPARNVTISDTLPLSMTSVISSHVGLDSCSGLRPLRCSRASDLAAGGVVTLTITGTVASDVPDNVTLRNTASVTSTEVSTPVASDEVTIQTNREVTLAISKVGTPGPVTAGTQITYSVRITNTGSDAALNLVLTDTLPLSVTLVASSTTGLAGAVCSGTATITCEVGSFSGGGHTGTLAITGTVAADAPTGTITNTAGVRSHEVTSTEIATTTTEITTEANLTVSVSETPSTGVLRTFDVITYTITITNDGGPSWARNLRITDTLPLSVTFGGVDSASAGIGLADSTDPDIVWTLANLADDASAQIVFTGTITGTGTISNSVAVTSDTSDPTTPNTADTPDREVLSASPILDLGTVQSSGYITGSPGITLTSSALVTDVDTIYFDTGILTVAVEAGSESSDRLFITETAQISTTGRDVYFDGSVIGLYQIGTGSNPLTVTLSASASITSVTELVRSVAYSNTSSNPSLFDRTIAFTITDGAGGVSEPVTMTLIIGEAGNDRMGIRPHISDPPLAPEPDADPPTDAEPRPLYLPWIQAAVPPPRTEPQAPPDPRPTYLPSVGAPSAPPEPEAEEADRPQTTPAPQAGDTRIYLPATQRE